MVKQESNKPSQPATKLPAKAPKQNAPRIYFPFGSYTSVVGVHTSLLAFSALFLPRTPISIFTEVETPRDSVPVPRDALLMLTEDPTRTVAWMCVGAFILQSWWASWIRGWALGAPEIASDSVEQTRLKLERRVWNSGRLKAFRNACLCSIVASAAFHLTLILFGAPITSHISRTLLLAALLSLLTVFTPAFVLGLPTQSLVTYLTWTRLFAEFSSRSPIERALVYPAVGTVLGSWVSAIPIALDWDRSWQAWPLTPAYGAIAGYVFGALSAFVISMVQYFAEANILSLQARQLASASANTKKSKSS